MTDYPFFAPGNGRSLRADQIPTIGRATMEDPAKYLPHKDLTHAVNVALLLGMPLLVTGEPGTGKTQLAYAVGHAFDAPVHKFETKSTSAARDLFYTFDALSAFKRQGESDQRIFIEYQALGRAILDAFAPDHPGIAALLPPTGAGAPEHSGPKRSVVLIDEIDKAPRDFPNDILNEIERLYFRVPELRNAATPGADGGKGVPDNLRPIVILTSNSEKGLPDPFLRRCVYFHIPFPEKAEMREIVAARIEKLTASSPMLADAIELFYRLRRNTTDTPLRKEPSTAELINWLQALTARGATAETRLKSDGDLVRQTMAVLLKNREDKETAAALIDSWLKA